MRRWLATTALLLVIGAAMPAYSDDAGDCSTAGVAACRRLADQGNAAAQHSLGIIYYTGQGVPKDHAEAVKWLRKAADQSYADAPYNVGVLYEKGLGVPQDYGE